MNIHILSGIRTRDPSSQAAADLRVKTAWPPGSAPFIVRLTKLMQKYIILRKEDWSRRSNSSKHFGQWMTMLQGNHSCQQQVWLPDRRKRKPQRKEKAYCLLLQRSLAETCLEKSLGNLLNSPLTSTKRNRLNTPTSSRSHHRTALMRRQPALYKYLLIYTSHIDVLIPASKL
jgi:hypothetical protein